MINQIHAATGAFYGAFAGMSGIIAQITIPALPKDFASWPVTAMLALLVVICLLIIYRQSAANSAASVEIAKAIVELSSKQGASSDCIDRLTTAVGHSNERVAELVTTLRNRPCLTGR